jgi:hypothetical protein
MVLAAAEHLGWRAAVHIWGDHAPGWRPSTVEGGGWGPPHDAEWFAKLPAPPVAALVRIDGKGADLLFGLEAGLHRFHGIAGQPSHLWVEALEPRVHELPELSVIAKKLGKKLSDDLLDDEWLALPGPPTPRVPRGNPMRDVIVSGDAVVVDGEEVGVPWREAAKRLPELAVARILNAIAKPNALEKLWAWARPLETVEMQLRIAKEEEEQK